MYLPTDRAHNILSIFGHLIRGAVWQASGNLLIDTKIAESIAHFCGKTLTCFVIMNFSSKFPKHSRFKSLKKLTLNSAFPKNLNVCSQLKYLKITECNPENKLQLQLRQYQKLEHLVLELVDPLTNDYLTKFLSLNPQLQKLELRNCEQITSSMLENIAEHLPGIESLCFRGAHQDSSYENVVPDNNMVHLGRLKNLF